MRYLAHCSFPTYYGAGTDPPAKAEPSPSRRFSFCSFADADGTSRMKLSSKRAGRKKRLSPLAPNKSRRTRLLGRRFTPLWSECLEPRMMLAADDVITVG